MQLRLVETLRPFPGMKHLDVAGGTGDVAFRILKAVRQAEIEGRARTGGNTSSKSPPGSVVVCDINPQVGEIQGVIGLSMMKYIIPMGPFFIH